MNRYLIVYYFDNGEGISNVAVIDAEDEDRARIFFRQQHRTTAYRELKVFRFDTLIDGWSFFT